MNGSQRAKRLKGAVRIGDLQQVGRALAAFLGGNGHRCRVQASGIRFSCTSVRRSWKLSNFDLHCGGVYSIAETRPTETLVDVEAPMSGGRHFPIRSFVASVVLVAVAAASVYLSYELVVKPRRALQDQIRAQQGTILKLQQEKQRLEAYLKILKRIDRRARVEVLRQGKDQWGNLQTTIRFTEVDDTGKPTNVSREMTLPGQEVYFDTGDQVRRPLHRAGRPS